ncbi:MAG: hypothetical protein H6656_14675, partial [Ardenticatenaceae bacterium]|nr:hypothetical protein [Ardenticatenaceae bacterium]
MSVWRAGTYNQLSMAILQKKWGRLGLVTLAVWLFFFLALDSMVNDSPTMDEQNHLAR